MSGRPGKSRKERRKKRLRAERFFKYKRKSSLRFFSEAGN